MGDGCTLTFLSVHRCEHAVTWWLVPSVYISSELEAKRSHHQQHIILVPALKWESTIDKFNWANSLTHHYASISIPLHKPTVIWKTYAIITIQGTEIRKCLAPIIYVYIVGSEGWGKRWEWCEGGVKMEGWKLGWGWSGVGVGKGVVRGGSNLCGE